MRARGGRNGSPPCWGRPGSEPSTSPDFVATQETAKPLADLLQLTPIEESDPVQLVAKLRTHGNETVLVVGHSDTVPDVIKAFGGPTVTIADDNFVDDLCPRAGNRRAHSARVQLIVARRSHRYRDELLVASRHALQRRTGSCNAPRTARTPGAPRGPSS